MYAAVVSFGSIPPVCSAIFLNDWLMIISLSAFVVNFSAFGSVYGFGMSKSFIRVSVTRSFDVHLELLDIFLA